MARRRDRLKKAWRRLTRRSLPTRRLYSAPSMWNRPVTDPWDVPSFNQDRLNRQIRLNQRAKREAAWMDDRQTGDYDIGQGDYSFGPRFRIGKTVQQLKKKRSRRR